MKRRTGVSYVTMAIALIVTACAGELEGTNGDDDVLGLGDRGLDRCSLISETEAEGWLGGPVVAAPSEGSDGVPDPVTCLTRVRIPVLSSSFRFTAGKSSLPRREAPLASARP